MNLNLKRNLFYDIGLDPNKTVLLGFSGGPDSLCLLHLLRENGYRVIAAHLDHGLRPSSANEAVFAQSVCREFGALCVTQVKNVAAFSRLHHFSVEEGARVLRYEFLFEEAVRCGAQAVLVAHNADDQVETVLMHLMRGSGLSGLAGMRAVLLPNPWSDQIPLVRPLIGINRNEIDSYLKEHHLKPVVDESNSDQQYFRNRFRHDLIPHLETYNPCFKDRILKMADVAAVEDDYLRNSIAEFWIRAVIQEGDHFLVANREILLKTHAALLRRFVRRAIEWMDPDLRDIDFDVINRAAGFCLRPTRSNHLDLLAGIELFLYRKNLVFAYVNDPLAGFWPQLQIDEEIEIPLSGEIMINPDWVLQIDRIKPAALEPSLFTAFLDENKLTGKLDLGRVRPGERFKPYGFDGHTKKVGDFWNSEGLPARARGYWPLVRAGGEIVWIPGFRIAHHVQVDDSTQNILRLRMKKQTGSE